MKKAIKRISIEFLVVIIVIIVIQSVFQSLKTVEGSDFNNNSKVSPDSVLYTNKTINLSNNIGHSELSRVAASGNNVYVVWADDTSGDRDIYFRKSIDNGCTFGPTIDISNQNGGSVDPQIAIFENNVYVIWEHTPENNGGIFFTRSTDNGTSFEKIQNIGNNTGFNGFPQIAVSGKNVYLAWHDATHGVVFTRSNDNGTSFERIQNIGNKTESNGFPQIAVSGDNVYLIWTNAQEKYGQVFFTKSTDDGATFKSPVALTDDKDNDRHKLVFNPRITVDPRNNNVYVVWHSGRIVHQYTYNLDALVSDVLYKRSTDNGATFDRTINLSNKSGWSVNPQIAVSQDNDVYVVWTNNAQEKYGQVFFTKSTDNGATFDRTINLSNKSGWSVNPQIAVSQDNNVYVVWTNNATGNEETIFKSNVMVDNCTFSDNRNSLVNLDNKTSADVAVLNIAFIDPTFTIAAYDKSFYLFYQTYDKKSDEHSNITDDRDLLSSIVPQKYEHRIEFHEIRNHLKWLVPKSNIVRVTDQDVDKGLIFNNGTNKYDIIVLSHEEYVTQQEYDNFKQFVANGGILILLDGNVFYTEIKYDRNTNTISLVEGHYWEFNGKTAWRGVEERWVKETSEWIGSNYLCCFSDNFTFNNNPFGYKHDEEQYITNPRAKILLDYNATEDKPNPRKFVVATYELDYKKGKVITLGLYTNDLSGNERFWRFFDSLLFQYALGKQETNHG